MAQRRTAPAGIIALGPTASGKTVFLTCLYYYGSHLDPKYVVTIDKGEEFVSTNLETLENHKWPEGSSRTVVRTIVLTVSRRKGVKRNSLDSFRKKRVTFSVPDYAGQLLTLKDSVAPGILEKYRDGKIREDQEEKIMDYIMSAKGYILIVDPLLEKNQLGSARYDRTSLQMDYVTLINILKEKRKSKRHLMVLVTKWDGVRDKSVEEYLMRTHQILMSHIGVCWAGDKVTYAAVSLDNNKEGDNAGPTTPLKPSGYGDVLQWMIRKF